MGEKEFSLTVGVFVGILNEEGKLLLQRRIEKDSIIAGKSFFGDYELPGGGLNEEGYKRLFYGAVLEAVPSLETCLMYEMYGTAPELKALTKEKVILEALKRRVFEEEGIIILLEGLEFRDVYQAVLIQREARKIDIALCVPVRWGKWSCHGAGSGREIKWVNVEELNDLTRKPKGEQLVSGFGKRMHRMALWALFYAHKDSFKALGELIEIHKEMKSGTASGAPNIRESFSVI